ncbi:MAG TPA: GspH/FimT family pseudopilin [Gammaproteobacteria bacterium]|nr:GspH/FimT family pseudopilin [Gammaproteobacteria bacterium]
MRAHRGFTLIELMITLLVAIVLLSIAIPNFSSLIKDNRITTQVNTMVRALQLARSTAIKRGQRVVVCRSANSTAASPTCDTGSGSWTEGWVVFVDCNNDAQVSTGVNCSGSGTQNEPIIDRGPPAPNSVTLVATGSTTDYVSYSGSGFPRLTNGLPQNGTIDFCDDRKTNNNGSPPTLWRVLTVSQTGSVQTETKDGIACP